MERTRRFIERYIAQFSQNTTAPAKVIHKLIEDGVINDKCLTDYMICFDFKEMVRSNKVSYSAIYIMLSDRYGYHEDHIRLIIRKKGRRLTA